MESEVVMEWGEVGVFTEYTLCVGGEGERLTGSSVLKEVCPV